MGRRSRHWDRKLRKAPSYRSSRLPGVRRSSCGRGKVRLTIPAQLVVGLAAIHLHFHHLFHHRFHGPPFDYLGLAFGALVSSAGFPGPGEALLITGAIVAAGGKLDIASVIAVAFVGATAGGIVGWVIGLKAGGAGR